MYNLINTALAHTGDADGVDFHHGFGMMGDWGWFGMASGWLFMILFWALVILAIVALVKWIQQAGGGRDGVEKAEKIYVCKECGYEYKDKEWALKCEEWCREHKSCNLDIIKHGTPPTKNE